MDTPAPTQPLGTQPLGTQPLGTQPPGDGAAVEVLTPDRCWSLLRSVPYGRLAVVVDGAPQIFPVNHVVDGGAVVLRTRPGTKLSAADGHRVAFEVDGHDGEHGVAWSVQVLGRADQLRGLHAVLDSFDLPLRTWQPVEAPRFVRITVDAISGRRFGVRPAPDGGPGDRRAAVE